MDGVVGKSFAKSGFQKANKKLCTQYWHVLAEEKKTPSGQNEHKLQGKNQIFSWNKTQATSPYSGIWGLSILILPPTLHVYFTEYIRTIPCMLDLYDVPPRLCKEVKEEGQTEAWDYTSLPIFQGACAPFDPRTFLLLSTVVCQCLVLLDTVHGRGRGVKKKQGRKRQHRVYGYYKGETIVRGKQNSTDKVSIPQRPYRLRNG